MKRLLYLSIFFLQFSRCTCCQHGGNNLQHNVTSRKDTLKVTTYLMEINEPKLDSLIKKIADTVVQLNRQRKTIYNEMGHPYTETPWRSVVVSILKQQKDNLLGFQLVAWLDNRTNLSSDYYGCIKVYDLLFWIKLYEQNALIPYDLFSIQDTITLNKTNEIIANIENPEWFYMYNIQNDKLKYIKSLNTK